VCKDLCSLANAVKSWHRVSARRVATANTA
jgi:hypothetical protein